MTPRPSCKAGARLSLDGLSQKSEPRSFHLHSSTISGWRGGLPLALAKLSNAFALQMGEMKQPIRSDDITKGPSLFTQTDKYMKTDFSTPPIRRGRPPDKRPPGAPPPLRGA